MIKLNQNLEKLNQQVSRIATLSSAFAKLPVSAVVGLCSTLDSSKKGYLSCSELFPSKDSEFHCFLNEKLGTRISYSALATYVQSSHNYSSILQISHGAETLKAQNLGELLFEQYCLENRKKQVLQEMGKYMLHEGGGISYCRFMEYCHTQKLAVNPKVVFEVLSGGEQQIESGSWGEKDNSVNMEGSMGETKDRICNLNRSIMRLNQRVDKFGMQWLL